MKPIELDFKDVNDPEYTRLSLWIGNRNVKLAKAILENIKE